VFDPAVVGVLSATVVDGGGDGMCCTHALAATAAMASDHAILWLTYAILS
jgi:hypothetical protein